jgi:hypothetical protein
LQGTAYRGALVLLLAQAAAHQPASGALRIGGERIGAGGAATKTELELALVSGERLRIGTGVDVTTLRAVLAALRA